MTPKQILAKIINEEVYVKLQYIAQTIGADESVLEEVYDLLKSEQISEEIITNAHMLFLEADEFEEYVVLRERLIELNSKIPLDEVTSKVLNNFLLSHQEKLLKQNTLEQKEI